MEDDDGPIDEEDGELIEDDGAIDEDELIEADEVESVIGKPMNRKMHKTKRKC